MIYKYLNVAFCYIITIIRTKTKVPDKLFQIKLKLFIMYLISDEDIVIVDAN